MNINLASIKKGPANNMSCRRDTTASQTTKNNVFFHYSFENAENKKD